MGIWFSIPEKSKECHTEKRRAETETKEKKTYVHNLEVKRDEQPGEMSSEASFMVPTSRTERNADDEFADLKEKPWRRLEKKGSWDEIYTNSLLEDITSHTINEKNVKNIRILLLGPIRAGKSSFINTIAAIDKGRTSQVTLAGDTGPSMTKKLKIYRPQGRLKHFRLLDTMGVEDAEHSGFNSKDLLHVIKGNVKPNYKFHPTSQIDDQSGDFNKNPKNKDKIHCIVFVMDANVVGMDNIPAASKTKIKALQDELISLDIPRMVLLTKIDVLCEMIETDIANCYRSAAMKKAVNLAKDLFRVPEQNIFPVQNYSKEMEIDPQKEILPLIALRQMIYFGTDFLNELSTATSDDEDSS